MSYQETVTHRENVSSTKLYYARGIVCENCASKGCQASPCLKDVTKESIVSMAEDGETCTLKTYTANN